MGAGKDIMTTKPFELDPDKALAVLKEAKALGRVVYMNSPGPTVPPDIRQIEEWREKYQLGRPIGVRSDVWVSYREKADGGWYDDPEKCPLAPVFRLGIYLINDLVRVFGEAEKVQALKSRIFTGRPTVDNAQLGIAYKNGAIANIFASFCVNDGQHYSNSTTFNFENGTVYRNVGPLAFCGGKRKLVVVSRHGEAEPVTETVEYGERSGDYPWETFHRAIKGEVIEGEITPEQIVAGLKVVAAMARAQKSEKTEIV
jgi:predicted dehydrogenase